MKTTLIILVTSLSLLGFRFDSDTEPEWTSSGQEKGIHLYERWVEINDQLKVRERKGEFIINCNLEDAETYLKDYTNCKQWMKGLQLVTVLPNDNRLIYFVLSLPWPLKNRDFTAQYSCERINSKTCIIKLSNVKQSYPVNKKYIHIKDYRASWMIEQISATECKVTFKTFSSDPPLFPQWMQEPVLKKLYFNNLKRLQECLNQLNHQDKILDKSNIYTSSLFSEVRK